MHISGTLRKDPPREEISEGLGGGGEEKFVSDNKCIRISKGDLGD
jgi:hypothetical protein